MSDFISRPEPDFDNDAYRGSLQQMLSQNLGELVRCDFLIGSSQVVSKAGVLYAVNEKYLILYQEYNETYVVCDIFNLKFVTFFDTRTQMGNQAAQQAAMMMRKK